MFFAVAAAVSLFAAPPEVVHQIVELDRSKSSAPAARAAQKIDLYPANSATPVLRDVAVVKQEDVSGHWLVTLELTKPQVVEILAASRKGNPVCVPAGAKAPVAKEQVASATQRKSQIQLDPEERAYSIPVPAGTPESATRRGASVDLWATGKFGRAKTILESRKVGTYKVIAVDFNHDPASNSERKFVTFAMNSSSIAKTVFAVARYEVSILPEGSPAPKPTAN